MKIPEIAVGLLTSPFQHNVEGPWVRVPVETFKQFTDVVTEYVKNAQMPNARADLPPTEARQPRSGTEGAIGG